jgi:hypothetical protein
VKRKEKEKKGKKEKEKKEKEKEKEKGMGRFFGLIGCARVLGGVTPALADYQAGGF